LPENVGIIFTFAVMKSRCCDQGFFTVLSESTEKIEPERIQKKKKQKKPPKKQ